MEMLKFTFFGGRNLYVRKDSINAVYRSTIYVEAEPQRDEVEIYDYEDEIVFENRPNENEAESRKVTCIQVGNMTYNVMESIKTVLEMIGCEE